MSRYTFRTTRKTAWLDDVLSKIPQKDLSDFIRETLIRGLQANVEQVSDKQQTIVEPVSNVCQTNIESVPILKKKDIADDDLDKKLFAYS